MSLSSQALGQQRGAAAVCFPSSCPGASPCREGETRCWPCPSRQGDARSCSISCPHLSRCSQLGYHFWRGVFIAGMINGANDMQTQCLKKTPRDAKVCSSSLGQRKSVTHPKTLLRVCPPPLSTSRWALWNFEAAQRLLVTSGTRAVAQPIWVLALGTKPPHPT